MNKCWVKKKIGDTETIDKLSHELNVDKVIANLLVQRNITTFEDAKRFFRPSLEHLHNPFLMRDMNKAVCHIDAIIRSQKKILIYGDYDVDGTTAVALVYSYFASFYDKIDFYIPNRDTEGYGVSMQGIDYAAQNDFKLIIALDCGIKAFTQIAYAKSKGIGVIVGDHHLPGDTLPDAFAILDPKRSDCPYPYKELSGCGIGFKLIQAHVLKNHKPNHVLYPYLDLLVVSIAADIVPITGENRVLAYYGLKLLNTYPRPGLEAVLRYSNILPKVEVPNAALANSPHYFSKELCISDLVFMVGPRINAAGRIEDGKNAVKLLLCQTIEEADAMAQKINNYNIERKNLDSSATEEATAAIENSKTIQSKKSIVLYNQNWHKGVIGIVASRLVEKYYKPTIILTYSTNSNMVVGSARSIKDFDIHSTIESCSHLLEHFGGHKYAAGLSVKPENLQAFIDLFEKKVEEKISAKMLVPEIEIDDEIALIDITPKFSRLLKQFAPFGPENMSPVFQSNNLVDTGFSRSVGSNHLKFSVIHLDVRSDEFSAIAFQFGSYLNAVKAGKPFNICYNIEENNWNGKNTIQLNVKDIKFNE